MMCPGNKRMMDQLLPDTGAYEGSFFFLLSVFCFFVCLIFNFQMCTCSCPQMGCGRSFVLGGG
ncbi:hypothetical protein BDV25DRAFT_63774 [Aspergillus avenaceus]|uniref:Uncharacterized protein n=1 Tax=Aspergillus avenaceus TaxID=36643 RepID=A0A5N6U949_ASPAV|nr:hypothetical protein BDV25DRAFT_63774 [Aspergillus avenaceus]